MSNNKPTSSYCKGNNSALAFFNNKDPKYFDGSNKEERNAAKKAVKEAMKDRKKAKEAEKEADKPKTGTPQKRAMAMEKRSIQSYHDGHSATFLCKSETSVGPSLVSFPERIFCHMPDKKLYKFCEDVKSGACWDQKAHKFEAKGPGAIHARAALPAIQFDAPLVWGKK